jgi:hypothetical protein
MINGDSAATLGEVLNPWNCLPRLNERAKTVRVVEETALNEEEEVCH